MTIRQVAWAAGWLLILAYPLLIYFWLYRLDSCWLLAGLVVLLLMRVWWAGWGPVGWGPALIAFGLLVWGKGLAVLLYPVLVNGFFLAWFAASLVRPPTVVERLARLSDPDLPPQGISYTRRVTWVWCGFFLLNGGLAAVTVGLGDLKLWTWYNGFLAYLLMGLLMLAEYLVRRRVKRAGGHG